MNGHEDPRPLGDKNFQLYRQNSDYLIYYEDNLLPVSTKPDRTISHFLGYFKCHLNPNHTNIICTDAPCSQVTFKISDDQSVYILRLKVDRLTEQCRISNSALLPNTENYLLADLVFPKNNCTHKE